MGQALARLVVEFIADRRLAEPVVTVIPLVDLFGEDADL